MCSGMMNAARPRPGAEAVWLSEAFASMAIWKCSIIILKLPVKVGQAKRKWHWKVCKLITTGLGNKGARARQSRIEYCLRKIRKYQDLYASLHDEFGIADVITSRNNIFKLRTSHQLAAWKICLQSKQMVGSLWPPMTIWRRLAEKKKPSPEINEISEMEGDFDRELYARKKPSLLTWVIHSSRGLDAYTNVASNPDRVYHKVLPTR